MFRNAAWFPTGPTSVARAVTLDELLERAVDRPDADAGAHDRDEVDRYEGDVPDGEVWTSTRRRRRWELTVDGRDASPFDGFGWGNAYPVEEGGRAALLEYSTPIGRHAVSGVQAAAWVVVAYVLLRTRRRRREVAA